MLIEGEILQRDIDAGTLRNCLYCPLALALHRVTGTRWWVTGTELVPWVRVFDRSFKRIPLCAELRAWVAACDAGAAVEPVRFALEVPDDVFAQAS